MTKVILPSLAEGVQNATITYWHFKINDKVNEGDDLVELATDKATFNLPAPAAGVLTEIYSSEGDQVSVGATIAVIA